ncbi:MAG: hypothetical protein ACOVQ4_11830 [Flectobacillus sp.]
MKDYTSEIPHPISEIDSSRILRTPVVVNYKYKVLTINTHFYLILRD